MPPPPSRCQETQCSTGSRPGDPRATAGAPEAGVLEPSLAGEEGLELRLHPGDGEHHRANHPRHLVEDRRHGAEIEGERHHLAAGRHHPRHEPLVGAEVGVPPAIDRLLGIADQEEAGALLRRAVEGEPAQQVALEAVGVLELVDQELVDPPPHLPPHLGVRGEQTLGADEEGVEGGDPPRAQLALDPRQERREGAAAVLHQLGIELPELRDELHQLPRGGGELRGDGAEEGPFGSLDLAAAPFLEVADEVLGEQLGRPGGDLGQRRRRPRGLRGEPAAQGDQGLLDLAGVARPGAAQAGGDQCMDGAGGLGQAAAEAGERRRAEGVLGEDVRRQSPLEEGGERLDDLGGAEAARGEGQQMGIAGVAVPLAEGVLHRLAHHLLDPPAVGVDDQIGMDPRLQRMVGEQAAAEGVDGAHRQVVEGAEEGPRPPRPFGGPRQHGGLEPPRGFGAGRQRRQLAGGAPRHLGRGGLGEGDRYHPAEHLGGDAVRPFLSLAPRPLRGPLGQPALGALPPLAEGPGEEAADQGRRLAGPRPRLEDEGDVEAGLRRPPGGEVGGARIGLRGVRLAGIARVAGAAEGQHGHLRESPPEPIGSSPSRQTWSRLACSEVSSSRSASRVQS